MKKILFVVFSLVCINAISQAQDTKEIKPFKPNAEDAAKIKSILASMDKSTYSIQVKQNSRSTAYGSLNKAKVSSGSAVTASIGKAGNSAWVEDILTHVLKSTKGIDQSAVAQLQAIASKY